MASNIRHENGTPRGERTRRQFIGELTGLAAALGAGASSLSRTQIARAATTGNRLVVALGANIESFDPHFSGGNSMVVYMNIYEPLLWKDPQGKLQPAIAESWARVDPTRWRFKIRKGIRFHSGRPCDPKAIEASFARYQNPQSPHAHYSYTNWITSIKAVSDDSIEMTTKMPYSSTLDEMSHGGSGVILDIEAVKQQGDLKDRPVGTGPFMLDRWETGKYVRLKRNPNYWGPAPKLDELEFRFIPEASTRTMALERAEIDLIFDATPDMVQAMANNPKLRVHKYPSWRVMSLEYNFLKPILRDNSEVRAAISLGIDTVGITKKIIGVKGEPACSVVHPTSLGYGCFGFPEYDPNKAKQLLDSAGWTPGSDGVRQKGGQRLVLDLTTDYTRDFRNREMVEAIQAMAAQVGVKINLTAVERAPYVDRVVNKGEHDLATMGWQPLMNADTALYPRFHSSSQVMGTWGTPRTLRRDLDEMLDAARAAKTDEEMVKAYQEFQKLIHEQHLVIPIYYSNHLQVSQAYVKGFREHPDEQSGRRYTEVTLDKG